MRPESHSSCGSTAVRTAHRGKEFFSDPLFVLESHVCPHLEKQMRTFSHPHYLYQILAFDPTLKAEQIALRSLLGIIEINFIIVTNNDF